MNLNRYKSLTVVAMLAVGIFVGASAFTPSSFEDDKPKRNLKVLPKDIADEDLHHVMEGFNAALGVKCNHCHAPSKTDDHKLDFASDEKPQKGWARDMMRMSAKINKKFFKVDVKNLNGKTPAVSCVTCHNGSTKPKSI
jgi:hypothetical protein